MPILYAHRGASSECPENTMVSFRRALELGADALETDAHMTADGHVVVSHDPTGARMCGVPAEIRATPLREVARWDAGNGFVDASGGRPFAGADCRIPTLEQLLAELPDVPLNIDLKQRRPSMVEPTIDVLRRMGAERRVTLASFHEDVLREVRGRGYGGPTALAQNEVLRLLLVPRLARKLRPVRGDAAQLPVRVNRVQLGSRYIVRKCHALGLRVDYWTVNEPAEAERLLALDADGIMTDDPRALAPVFERRRRDAA